MLDSRQNNIKIKYLHERCLRRIQNDKLSSYEEPLENDGSVSVHQRRKMLQIQQDQSRETDIFTHTEKIEILGYPL